MKKASSGFTLIEVLIAMLILAGAIAVLMNSWSGSRLAYRKSQSTGMAVSLLKKKITELELKYKQLSFTEIPEEENGTFDGESFKQYRWTSKVQELEFPDMTSLLVSQEEGASEMLLTVIKQMTDTFSQNIKELKVSIFWKPNDKEIEYSLTTYVVNFQQGGLSGLGGVSSEQGGGGR